MSDGRITLSTSTLYSALSRLLDRRLIERVPDDAADHGGPGLPRKAYVLSEDGRRVLDAETNRMHALVSAARARLGGEAI